MGYIIGHNGQNPPPGVYQDVSNTTASGGRTWGQFVEADAGVNLVDYAISGATCSNDIISRYFDSLGFTFPAVLGDEIPSFTADVAFKSLFPNRTADNTVYALWIGTNDLGIGAFLDDYQTPGATISDFVGCLWDVFDAIYKTGGRRFVLFNQAPLEQTPLYATPEDGGAGDNQYWVDKTKANNVTESSQKIREYSTSVNTMIEYGVPFHLVVKSRWPGATFTIFNVHQLLQDIIKSPGDYLDAPADATGFYHHCKPTDNSDCTDSENSASSFLWFDELHPSEKAGKFAAHARVTSREPLLTTSNFRFHNRQALLGCCCRELHVRDSVRIIGGQENEPGGLPS